MVTSLELIVQITFPQEGCEVVFFRCLGTGVVSSLPGWPYLFLSWVLVLNLVPSTHESVLVCMYMWGGSTPYCLEPQILSPSFSLRTLPCPTTHPCSIPEGDG